MTDDLTMERLMRLEARLIELESESWELKRRLHAAERWQEQTDAAWREFPAALKRGFENA